MGSTLSPICDACNRPADRHPEGYVLMDDMGVICLRCLLPDAEERAEFSRDLSREARVRFELEHGRAPHDAVEIIRWLAGNVGGERGPLHLIGPMPDED